MAIPTIALNTPDQQTYNSERPELEFTGYDVDGHPLNYGVHIHSPTYSTNDYVAPAMYPKSVVYDGSRFIGVSSQNPRQVMESMDGITWSSLASGFPQSDNLIQGAVSETGIVVYVRRNSSTGASICRYSEDDGLLTNTGQVSVGSIDASVAYGNGLFVACSAYSAGVSIYTSPDGITWTPRANSLTGPSRAGVVLRYIEGKFIGIVGGRNEAKTLIESLDGITWTETSIPSLINLSVTELVFAGGYYIATGSTQSSGYNRIYRSPDGVNWSAVSHPQNSSGQVTSAASVDGVVYLWLYGVTPAGLYVSYDYGATFNYIPGPAPLTAGIAYGNSRLLLARDSNCSTLNLISVDSAVDSGFTYLADGDVESPFPEGGVVRYKSEANIRAGEYTWTARAIDPGGDNEWGNWAAPRVFQVTRPPNPGIFMQFLT